MKKKKISLENLKKPAHTRKTLSKKRKLKNPEESIYIKKTFNKLRKSIKNSILVTLKALAFISSIKNSNFDSFCILYITIKQT